MSSQDSQKAITAANTQGLATEFGKFKLLDLFSGIGGFSLGLERSGGFETVAFCEIDPFARKVLAKNWPQVPCYDDVRTLTAERLCTDGIIPDAICGGFPCQDLSFAGKGAGLAGERSGLWSEIARLARDLQPRFIVVENVAALLSRGMGDVLGDLAAIGYDAEWHCIPASAVGAPHRRDRVWIVAYPAQERPDARLEGIQAGEVSRQLGRELGRARFQWLDQPAVCRVDDGLPPELDGHSSLGNAVIPQIPELIGRAIMAAEERA